MDFAAAPSRELVSVIVPAYQAEQTLDQALSSARSQTHQNLEILVIDDGSTDATARIARDHESADPRVRLILQANQGVAAARNNGVAQAKGRYVAPLDADDLWAPDKIALQLKAFQDGGDSVGLAYTWYASVDEAGVVAFAHPGLSIQGELLKALSRENPIGCASAPLIRRDLLVEVGGYDGSLRAQAAQGSEDWKLYMQLAERSDFIVIPDYLVGYRRTPANMSRNVLQMLRSSDLCRSEIAQRRPDLRPSLHQGRNRIMRHLLRNGINERAGADLVRLYLIMLRHDPLYALATAPWLVFRRLSAVGRRKTGAEPPRIEYLAWRRLLEHGRA